MEKPQVIPIETKLSGGAIAWIVWSALWAFFWLTLGWLTFPINLIMFPVSILLGLVYMAFERVPKHGLAVRPTDPGWGKTKS